MVKHYIEEVKNFLLGAIIFIGAYLILNYILYAIEKYVN